MGARGRMSDYTIRTDVKYQPLEKIDVDALQRSLEPWYNQTLCRINNMVMRLGVVEGEFHWHKHDGDDEFFYVIDGQLFVDVEGRESVELLPGQGFVVPAASSTAPERRYVPRC